AAAAHPRVPFRRARGDAEAWGARARRRRALSRLARAGIAARSSRRATMMRRLVAAASLLVAACAGIGTVPDAPPAPDLRGVYRAALCSRPDMSADECASTLRAVDDAPPAPAPPSADPSRYRLLFVPGFMASCFRGIHSFGDVIVAARKQGYAADALAVGGRNGVDANAKMIAEQIERLPDDGRRIILIGHSKGADDALQMLVTRPDLAPKVVALLSVAGALNG